MTLEAAAERWIEGYWNERHLLRTRDWLLEVEPDASEALRVAALVHDCERMFPGGPAVDPSLPPDDEEYTRVHSELSARYAAEWLREQAAPEGLVAEVDELVRLHEVGGTRGAGLVQAADSLSFLEVNGELVVRWVRDGRATPEQSRAKLDHMLARISVPRARELAEPLHERAAALLEVAVP